MLPRSIALADTLVSSLPAQALKPSMDAPHNIANTQVEQGCLLVVKSEPDGPMRKEAKPAMPLEADTHAGVGQKEGC